MKKEEFTVSGNIVDVVSGRIYRGIVVVSDGKVKNVTEDGTATGSHFILPGLIDAHIHIESSMLVPSEFARIAVTHGTVATVSDPHEIANVMGLEGVEFMIENGRKVPLKFYFGASPCVPATAFETSGASIGVDGLEKLMRRDDVLYMAEMMNYPGVIFDDPEIKQKLDVAKKYGKPVDGHSPGLRGKDAKKYVDAGISTDHECFSLEEALEKISYGMHILIREGSAAKNFEALSGLLETYPEKVMFCSDDRHPDDLVKEHVNGIVKKALKKGYDPVNVIRACTLNPVRHYGLGAGLLREGDAADMVIVDSLEDFNILKTYIDGLPVAEKGKSLLKSAEIIPVNRFNATKITEKDIEIEASTDRVRVIGALDGQLVTESLKGQARAIEGKLTQDVSNDLLKLVVMNRYRKSAPATAFIKGFGLKKGAIASTVAHDSHNIIAVGADDKDIVTAINLLVESNGGIVAVVGKDHELLPLPVAGIMSADNGWSLARKYETIDKMAKGLGSTLAAPFMTLSFMALLVIPDLKLSDKGLFDGSKFEYTSLELI